MNLLAIETSTEQLSLAVLRGETLFARDVHAGQKHSDLTLPLLQELMAESGLAMADLDVIAFGQGPGSFTGVRIACGLTQGIAFGLGVPVVPVETQMALAEQAGADKVLVALDARMGEIYLAAYVQSAADPSGWSSVISPCLVKPDALPDLPGMDWIGFGSAFDVPALGAALADRYGASLPAAGTGALPRASAGALPRASDIARIAARRLARAGMAAALPAEQAAPLYLRNKVAMTTEERRAAKETAKETAKDAAKEAAE